MPDLTRDEIEGLAARLTTAQRRIMAGLSFAEGSTARQLGASNPMMRWMVDLGLAKKDIRGRYWITPLGEQVRALAQQVPHAR